jgi:hypothetical protein
MNSNVNIGDTGRQNTANEDSLMKDVSGLAHQVTAVLLGGTKAGDVVDCCETASRFEKPNSERFRGYASTLLRFYVSAFLFRVSVLRAKMLSFFLERRWPAGARGEG